MTGTAATVSRSVGSKWPGGPVARRAGIAARFRCGRRAEASPGVSGTGMLSNWIRSGIVKAVAIAAAGFITWLRSSFSPTCAKPSAVTGRRLAQRRNPRPSSRAKLKRDRGRQAPHPHGAGGRVRQPALLGDRRRRQERPRPLCRQRRRTSPSGLDHQGDDALHAVRAARRRVDCRCRRPLPVSRARRRAGTHQARPSRRRDRDSVEDAIEGIVTRSANDAAVVVAEALGGTEDNFAAMMTRKARSLGMTRTVYHNASGLPDAEQVTTARDLAVLGIAIQDRFPRYYRYFQTRSFVLPWPRHRQPQQAARAMSRASTASRPAIRA